MNPTQVTYLTFGGLLLLALIFDLGILSKRDTAVSISKALWQTLFWVGLSVAFCIFFWFEKVTAGGHEIFHGIPDGMVAKRR